MKTIDEQVEAVEHSILSFEKYIQNTQVTKATIDKAQAHLDGLEEHHPASAAATDGRLLARMYEFQVLIDYAKGDLKRVHAFINEARKANPGNQFISETVAQLAGMGGQVENKGEAGEGSIPFFVTSFWRFGGMLLVSLGFYTFYWFYKNWRAVEKTTGRRQLPILSAIFCRFVSYNLFLDIKRAAEANGYNRPFSPGWRAVAFFFVGPLALININEPMEAAGGQRPTQMATGEVILLILGLLYWGMVIIGSATEDYNDYDYSNYNQIDSSYGDYEY